MQNILQKIEICRFCCMRFGRHRKLGWPSPTPFLKVDLLLPLFFRLAFPYPFSYRNFLKSREKKNLLKSKVIEECLISFRYFSLIKVHNLDIKGYFLFNFNFNRICFLEFQFSLLSFRTIFIV